MNSALLQLIDLDKFYSRELRNAKAERSKLPEGTLVIMDGRTTPSYYHDTRGNRSGISRNDFLKSELARAAYLDRLIKQYEKNHTVIQKAIKELRTYAPRKDPEDYAIKRFRDTDIDLRKVLWSAQQFHHNEQTSQNRFMTDQLQYVTNGGVYVRSLSEKLIGNLYEDLWIPYWYEKEFVVDVTAMGEIPGAYYYNGRWYKKYYPDFTLMLANGKLMVHEHFGLVEGTDYRGNVGEKIVAYTSSGLFKMEDIIVTYPDDVRDIDSFREFLISEIKPYAY